MGCVTNDGGDVGVTGGGLSTENVLIKSLRNLKKRPFWNNVGDDPSLSTKSLETASRKTSKGIEASTDGSEVFSAPTMLSSGSRRSSGNACLSNASPRVDGLQSASAVIVEDIPVMAGMTLAEGMNAAGAAGPLPASGVG